MWHNVKGTVWHSVIPCYSHAGHIGSDTDSNSKSQVSIVDTKGANSNGTSQQRRVAVCTSQCITVCSFFVGSR